MFKIKNDFVLIDRMFNKKKPYFYCILRVVFRKFWRDFSSVNFFILFLWPVKDVKKPFRTLIFYGLTSSIEHVNLRKFVIVNLFEQFTISIVFTRSNWHPSGTGYFDNTSLAGIIIFQYDYFDTLYFFIYI